MDLEGVITKRLQVPSVSCTGFMGIADRAARGGQGKALAKAKDLFWEADKDGNGVLSMGELRDMLREHSREYSHFAEHARFLDGCSARCSRRAEACLLGCPCLHTV